MSKWISVKDRLPEENVRVLTASSCEFVDIGYRYCGEWIGNPRIAHWQPLPELPEGE